MRLFVAVWPPEEVLDRLAELERPEVHGVRWTGREHWHVTLRFLGPVADVEPVRAALAGVEPSGRPTTAVLGPAVGRFGRRILHVPVAGLDEVAAAVVRATAHLGKPPDDRPFAGHVTLARVAKDAKVDLRPLTGTAVSAEGHPGRQLQPASGWLGHCHPLGRRRCRDVHRCRLIGPAPPPGGLPAGASPSIALDPSPAGARGRLWGASAPATAW